jgi:hypothetical protein
VPDRVPARASELNHRLTRVPRHDARWLDAGLPGPPPEGAEHRHESEHGCYAQFAGLLGDAGP